MANPSLQIGNSKWAIKKDNLLGYSTAGTRFLPIPITMTRASAGTRVNAQGLVETVELLGSEDVVNGDFATDLSGWTTNGVGATFSPLLFTNTANNGQIRQDFTTVVGVDYKLSIEITSGSWSVHASTSTSSGGSLGNITATGELIFTATTTTTYILCYLIGASGTEGVIDNVSVKEYQANDLARVDYTGSTSSLLVEPMRTNLVETSTTGEYGNSPASEILTIAPDGTNTAIRPVPNANADRYQYTTLAGTYSSGDVLTYSWYRKRISTPVNTVYVGDLNANTLVNATQVGVTIEIASNINGYDRFSATLSITDGSLSSILRFYFGAIIGVGNSSVAYWGHQLEVGSYATSYIPTSGGTVTRVKDQYTKTGISDKINSEEGVLFVEGGTLSDDGSTQIISLFESSSSRLSLTFSSTLNRIQFYAAINGYTNTVTINAEGFNKTQINKIAIRYGANNYALFINGVKEGENTAQGNAFTVGSLSELTMSNSNPFYGKVKQLQVYKTALTDSELIALTT